MVVSFFKWGENAWAYKKRSCDNTLTFQFSTVAILSLTNATSTRPVSLYDLYCRTVRRLQRCQTICQAAHTRPGLCIPLRVHELSTHEMSNCKVKIQILLPRLAFLGQMAATSRSARLPAHSKNPHLNAPDCHATDLPTPVPTQLLHTNTPSRGQLAVEKLPAMPRKIS